MSFPYTEGRDAAFAQNIGNFSGVVAGYIGGSNCYHTWDDADWAMFKQNPKLPIWVPGTNAEVEGQNCVKKLIGMGIARGRPVVVDMETRVDTAFLTTFGDLVQNTGADNYGWPVLVYGSLDTVYRNIGLSGYWTADYTGRPHMAENPATHSSRGTRGTQYANDIPPGYDLSMWKDDIVKMMWH